jgi:hypothetical protein
MEFFGDFVDFFHSFVKVLPFYGKRSACNWFARLADGSAAALKPSHGDNRSDAKSAILR